MIVIDASLLKLPIVSEGIKPETVFLINSEVSPAEIKAMTGLEQKIITVPANDISFKLFRRSIPNSAMLGAFAKAVPEIITLEKLKIEAKHVFEELLGPDLVEKNLLAIQDGYDKGVSI